MPVLNPFPMLLSINYSSQASALFAENHIQLDRFKCPDWPDMIAEASRQLPVAVHFGLHAGSGRLHQNDWSQVEHWLHTTQTPYVNLHLDPFVSDYPDIPIETTEPAQIECLVAAMQSDIQAACRQFGPERVIVENIPYRGRGGKVLRPAVEPHIIRQLLTEANCGLLLDISHARIAAHHLGMDEIEYMKQLPIDRVREMHFTGLHSLDGRLEDHLEALDTDWPVLDWVLERIRSGDWARPWMLAFEYGGSGEIFAWRSKPQVIRDQVPLLFKRVKSI